jgi:hypothetical protein
MRVLRSVFTIAAFTAVLCCMAMAQNNNPT